MEDAYRLTKQDQATHEMIHGSLYRCHKAGLEAHRSKLPPVTEEMREYGKSLVSGQIRLMRRSNPEYYANMREVLSAHQACLCYISEDFTVFGRYGCQELKDELRSKNLCLGAKLSEKIIGTNAAIMVPRCQRGVWVIGEDHYIDALKDYACYAFRIEGRYDRNGVIMLKLHALLRVDFAQLRLRCLFRQPRGRHREPGEAAGEERQRTQSRGNRRRTCRHDERQRARGARLRCYPL